MDSTLELKIWSGLDNIPSVHLESLQFWAYAKLAGVPVKVSVTRNPLWSAGGGLPLLTYKGKSYTKFSEVVNLFSLLNVDPDAKLDSAFKADVSAHTALLQEKLYPAIQYTWWLDRKNFEDVSRPCFARASAWPLNFYYPGHFERKAKELMEALFPMTNDMKFIETEVYAEAQNCLNTLSAKLGNKKFFFGDEPTSFDATLYAYLTPTLKKDFPSKQLGSHIKGCSNLVNYVDRITKAFFPDSFKVEPVTSKNEKSLLKKSQTLTKSQHIALSAVIALTSMVSFAYFNGILEFGEMAADDDEETGEVEVRSHPGSFYENLYN